MHMFQYFISNAAQPLVCRVVPPELFLRDAKQNTHRPIRTYSPRWLGGHAAAFGNTPHISQSFWSRAARSTDGTGWVFTPRRFTPTLGWTIPIPPHHAAPPPHSLSGTRPPRPSRETSIQTTHRRRTTRIVWTSTTPPPRDVTTGRHQETSRRTSGSHEPTLCGCVSFV